MATVVATTTANSITIAAANETAIVMPGVSVGGLDTDLPGTVLINYGTVNDTNGNAVNFEPGSGGQLINKPDGAIVGQVTGVLVDASASVSNDGVVVGITQYGIHFAASANNDSVVNTGDIFGALGGITASSGSAFNVSISNFGEIRSDQHGIWLLNATGAAPAVFNSGVVIGRANSIYATAGDRLNVVNTGTLNGHVRGDSAELTDSVTNNKTIIGSAFLGSGNDVYKGIGVVTGTVSGEAGNDSLTGGNVIDRFLGGTDNDTLTGNGGNDVLVAGDGNDTIFGAAGVDSISCGSGNDSIFFNTAPNSSTNRDIISDFSHVADTFRMENAVFTRLGAPGGLNGAFFRAGAAALDANDYVIYNQTNGGLFYDSNGNLAGGLVQIAVLQNKPLLAANDFVVI